MVATPNTSPEWTGYRLIDFIVFFAPFQTMLVALRFYARSLTVAGYAVDDWLILAALLSQYVAMAIGISGVKQGGIGYHVGYLEKTDPARITSFYKHLTAAATWYFSTVGISKVAICLFYHRLFPKTYIRVALHVTTGVIIATSVAASITNMAACRPFWAHWASSEVQAVQCFNKEPLYVWSSMPNIITDVLLLFLPLPTTWKLHTSLGMKVALTITFMLGSLGLITSVLRFIFFARSSNFADATGTATELYIWTIVEPGIYMISACLLTYRPLLEKLKLVGGGSTRAKKDSSGPRACRPGLITFGSSSQNRKLGLSRDGEDVAIALCAKNANGWIENAERIMEARGEDAIRTTTEVILSWENEA